MKTIIACILGILTLTAILLLMGWYITAIVFALLCFLVLVAFMYDDKTYSRTKQDKSDRRYSRRNQWNEFSDPNDFPSDGCGNNGW